MLRCQVTLNRKSTTVLVKTPTREQRLIASEVYESAYADAEAEGLYSEGEAFTLLLSEGLFTTEDQKYMDDLPKEIERFKVGLYESQFKTKEKGVIRKALAKAKAKLAEVTASRYSLVHLTCAGSANIAKSRYLLGASLYRTNGRAVFTDEQFWSQPSALLDEVLSHYHKARLEEPVYRELARTEPWRSIWSVRKTSHSLFGVAA